MQSAAEMYSVSVEDVTRRHSFFEHELMGVLIVENNVPASTFPIIGVACIIGITGDFQMNCIFFVLVRHIILIMEGISVFSQYSDCQSSLDLL